MAKKDNPNRLAKIKNGEQPAICHPDRPIRLRGWCNPCYVDLRRNAKKQEELTGIRPEIIPASRPVGTSVAMPAVVVEKVPWPEILLRPRHTDSSIYCPLCGVNLEKDRVDSLCKKCAQIPNIRPAQWKGKDYEHSSE